LHEVREGLCAQLHGPRLHLVPGPQSMRVFQSSQGTLRDEAEGGEGIQMKDCFGETLVPGDIVIVVAPSAPMQQCYLHMLGEVVKRRGRKVGIRFPDSDYVKYNKYVLPDSIMKKSSFDLRSGKVPSQNDKRCRACREPELGAVCLCGHP